ncbi:spermatogenesis-associated protein 1 [Maniola hyperantus]|uniref:spermatogenesis-associated protein 1 n=1 Tax=Aphantopus hyperantus TaxID=2795564 RepID=UPI002129D608
MAKTIGEENEELERLNQEEQMSEDLETTKLKEKMEEIIEKFRQSADFYDQEKMIRATEKARKVMSDLLAEKKSLEEELAQLNNILDNMKSEIPENILEIVGKTELEKKLQDLQKLHAELCNEKK